MQLFEFDEIGPDLKLLPIAACRALDAVGLKLSRDGFLSLTFEQRSELVRLGALTEIEVEAVRKLTAMARPAPTSTERALEPAPHLIPAGIVEALGPQRSVPLKVWQELEPLERYALMKACKQPHEPRLSRAYDEIIGARQLSTHLRAQGGVQMVSVTKKEAHERTAVASSRVMMSADCFRRLTQESAPKGDVLATARIAGLMATKRTAELIPLCHPLALTHADIDFELKPESHSVTVRCSTTVIARTGVEMEAMMGASIAALTIYDMLKSIDRSMTIGPTELLEKHGGRTGSWHKEVTP